MQLSKEAIEEYKKIYKEAEHKEISDEETREQGHGLLICLGCFLKTDSRELPKKEGD